MIIYKQGFDPIRQKGHVRLEHADGRKTSVPLRSGESIHVGLLENAHV